MPGDSECTRRLDARGDRHARRHDALRGLEARRVPGHDADEVVPLDRVEAQIVDRSDGCRSRNVAQERDLAEEVAGAEGARLRAVEVHPRGAGLDRVEAVAVLALREDG